jgi:hypothetical protein
MPDCRYCAYRAFSARAIEHHLSRSSSCRALWTTALYAHSQRHFQVANSRTKHDKVNDQNCETGIHEGELDLGQTQTYALDEACQNMEIEVPVNQHDGSEPTLTTASRRPTIEDVPDDGGDYTSTEWRHYVQEFDAVYQAGVAIGEGPTNFESIREEQTNTKESPWAGFGDKAEWEFAKFMIETLGHNDMEKLLRLDLVRP